MGAKARSAVNYSILDPFKLLGQAESYYTKGNAVRLGAIEVTASRGESVYLMDLPGVHLAHVIEGIGTKPDVADTVEEIFEETGQSPYFNIAVSAVATIVNDLVTSGALPISVLLFMASGKSEWFADRKRGHDFLHGWRHACMTSRANWGGGETQALRDIVYPDKVVIAGSAVGIIRPKKRRICGNVHAGDAIVFLGSSGIHDNGLTDARDVAHELPEGYRTILACGKMYGEALLAPTKIYSPFIEACHEAGIKIRYAINITGHGWRKLMRHEAPFACIIDNPPKPTPLFDVIEKYSGFSKKKMYGTFNMGAGYALIVRRKDVERVCKLGYFCNIPAWHAGYVEKSNERRVEIRLGSEKIEFHADELQIR